MTTHQIALSGPGGWKCGQCVSFLSLPDRAGLSHPGGGGTLPIHGRYGAVFPRAPSQPRDGGGWRLLSLTPDNPGEECLPVVGTIWDH